MTLIVEANDNKLSSQCFSFTINVQKVVPRRETVLG